MLSNLLQGYQNDYGLKPFYKQLYPLFIDRMFYGFSMTSTPATLPNNMIITQSISDVILNRMNVLNYFLSDGNNTAIVPANGTVLEYDDDVRQDALVSLTSLFKAITSVFKNGTDDTVDFKSVRPNILVVEDQEINQKYICTLLKRLNMDFLIAENGQMAIEFTNKYLFDMILMDIQMPVMDGLNATIAIRNTDNLNRNTPIIAITALNSPEHRESTAKVGMNDFLNKPFASNDFVKIIQKYIPHYSLERVVFPDKGLNRSVLNELYGDDHEYAADMFETFLQEVLPDFKQGAVLIKAKRWNDFYALVHKLKPTLGMVGLSDLQKKIITLESEIKQGINQDKYDATWTKILQNLDQVVPVLQNELYKLRK